MLDRFRQQTDHEEQGYEAVEVGPDLAADLATDHDGGVTPSRDAIAVRPNEDNGGIEAMDTVLKSLHAVRQESPRFRRTQTNISPAHAFEARYAPVRPGGDHVVTLQYVAGDDRLDGTMERQLRQQYPDSDLDRRDPTLLDVAAGDWVAGSTLAVRRYTLYPIKNIDQPGFDTDPTGSIIQEMVGAGGTGSDAGAGAEADVAVQIMFRPEDRTWTDGVPNGQGVGDIDDRNALGGSAPSLRDLVHELRQPTLEEHRRLFTWETIEHPPSAVDKTVADLLERQRGDKGWHLCIHVFAASSNPDEVIRRASTTAGMFRNFYQHQSEQTFIPQPLQGDALRAALREAAARTWQPTGIVKSQREVAGLVNVPKAEFVNTTDMKWALSSPGRGVPPGTPRFDFDTASVAHTGAGDSDRQAAMLDHGDVDAPIWYGRGSRAGTEAGVFPDVLATHQFVGGATGQGKTTLLKNLTRQLMNRGHGVLFYDPKGMDAADLVSVVPEDRAEDLIYLEVGGDRDRSVGFNFLEPPTDADPDSQVFVDAIESMTDDIAALLAQSSGSNNQNYWGPRMDQIARNLVRGMAQAGHQCTLLDMYLALLDERGRDEYAQMLRDDRLDWLSTYADHELTDMSQDDIRPVLGRLKELVENQTTREIISHPESTVSIRDAVRDGRIIVVRDMSSQDNAGRMVATALIRRIWVAVRELTMDPGQPDPPGFYAVLDEFDDIAAASSNIDHILSNARSFGLSITAATQDLTAQLDEDILNAIEGQCQTFLSFNPGRLGDAKIIAKQHSPDVDDEDLLNLSKYKLFMRTHDRDDELTHSYKVDAFPPLEDVTDVGRAEPAVDELIDQSLQRYGAPRRSSVDAKADSPFFTGTTGTTVGAWEGVTTEEEVRAVVQGVYDTAVRAGTHGAYIELGECQGPIVRRLERCPSTPGLEDLSEIIQDAGDLWRRAVQHVGDDRLAIREHDGRIEVRAENPRSTIAQVGADQSAGGAGHALLMWDAYGPLTWSGLDVEINEASGADADALARPAPDGEQRSPALVERLTGGREARVESESSTGTSKAGMTAQHVLQAAAEGRRTIVLARPDTAENVADTLLEAPRLCRSNHDVVDETRFYTSPRDLRIDGERVTQPGARENVWVRDELTGEIVLRDGDGEEHARFGDAEAVFSRLEAYPRQGETAVKQPIIPEYWLGEADDPHAEILAVPEGASQLEDIQVVVDADGLTVPATAIGSEQRVDPDDLDVSDGARQLLSLLRAETPGTVTSGSAHELATSQGNAQLNVTRRTVRNWLGALADAGAIESDDSTPGPGIEYRIR